MKLLTLSILAICSCLAIADSNMKNLWDQVIRKEKVIITVQYFGNKLDVWRENSHNYSRFYVTPLCIFDRDTTKCTKDDFSDDTRFIFSFNVRLWDNEAAELIQKGLKLKGIEAPLIDIHTLPMQMVQLSSTKKLPNKVIMDSAWRSNHNQPNIITLDFAVTDEQFCHEQVNKSKADPATFLQQMKLDFKFTLLAGKEEHREVNINGQNIINSQVFSQLLNKYTSATGQVYLQSDDANKLAKDVYQKVVVEDKQTSGHIPAADENDIIMELLNNFKQHQVKFSEIAQSEWDSIFWDDIYARPDIQTSYFNESFTYNAKEDHFKFDEGKANKFHGKINETYNSSEGRHTGGSAGIKIGWFSIGGSAGKLVNSNTNGAHSNDTETNEIHTVSKDELKKFIDENKANVQWTGTKFEPKDVTLYRVNTHELKASGNILYKKIITTVLTATQEVPITVDPKLNTNYLEELHEMMKKMQKQIDDLNTANQPPPPPPAVENPPPPAENPPPPVEPAPPAEAAPPAV